MRSIPCAFIQDERTGILTPRPRFQWFAEGKGIARRKWDGLPSCIQQDEDGKKRLYRGITVTRREKPEGFRSAEIDDGANEMTGWVQVTADDPDDDLYRQGVYSTFGNGRPFEIGFYWLCGPGINGNLDGFEQVTLVPEDFVTYIYTPRTLDEAVYFLAQNPCQGIIWSYQGSQCELTRQDIGLSWGTGA